MAREPGFKKTLDLPGLTAFYVSSIVGAGILFIPQIAARIAGPSAVVAWLVLIGASSLFAVLFARMAVEYPHPAGLSGMIEVVFGKQFSRAAALLTGLTHVIGNPLMAFASAEYILSVTGMAGEVRPGLVAFFMMILSIGFNLVGLKLGGKVQSVVLTVMIGMITVVVLASIPHWKSGNLVPFFPKGQDGMLSAIAVAFYSFLGWENVYSVSREVKSPETTFPRAIRRALVIVGALYVGLALALAMAVPYQTVAAGGQTVLGSIASLAFPPMVVKAINLVAVVIIFLATNSWVLGASRVVVSVAHEGFLPAPAARLSRQGTPVAALCVLLGVYTPLIIVYDRSPDLIAGAIKLCNANFVVMYLLAFAAALRTFRQTNVRRQIALAIVLSLAAAFCIGPAMLLGAGLFGLGLLLAKVIAAPQLKETL
jgi:amino acid efflux transporter